MRFSTLHFLLLGTALAAPAQDISRVEKDAKHENLIASGAVPVLPRFPAPVALLVPVEAARLKPTKPAPHDPVLPLGPDSPTGPPPPVRPAIKPAPGPSGDDTPALRPGDEIAPSPNTPNEPPANPPKTLEDPAVSPKSPDEPNTSPKDTSDPSISSAKSDKDGNLNSSACAVARRGKRAPQCAPSPPELQVDPNSLWARNDIEKSRQDGFQWRTNMEQAITEGRPGNGFRPQPGWDSKENRLNENNRYKVETEKLDDPKWDVTLKPYLEDARYGDTFKTDDKKPWFSTTVKNNDAQSQAFNRWRDEYRKALNNNNPASKHEDIDKYIDTEIPIGAKTEMLSVETKPATGAMIIKMSSQGEDDFYRARQYTKLGPGATGKNKYDFDDIPGGYSRPKFGDGSYGDRDNLNWSDQTWAAWIEACANTSPPTDPKSIRAMGQDNIVTTKSRDTIDAIMEQKKVKVGATFTLQRPRPGTEVSPADAAFFDAAANIPQGKGPIQMATGVQSEAPGLVVNAYHITTKSSK